MSLLQQDTSAKGLILSWCNLIEVSKGVVAGLEARRPEESNRSRQYFLCEIEIPFLE